MTEVCPECGCILKSAKARTQKTHSHYFALIHDAWESLPEAISGEFPSPEHLRKYALIKAGFCTTHKMICAHNKAAIEASALVMDLDEFAICEVQQNIVSIYRAQSQSYKAMGRDVFQRSKERVLEVLSEMVGAEVAA